jgi:hypothetical protein
MPLNLSGKKFWATTKSKKISIIEKYNDLIKKIESIDPFYKNDMISTEELHKEFFVNFPPFLMFLFFRGF